MKQSNSVGTLETVKLQNGAELTVQSLREAIPKHLFIKSESRFLVSVFYSLFFTLGLAYLAYKFIPISWLYLPIWIIYALVTGTIGTGLWVLGHECGHFAFSEKVYLNDILGYILHTALLVPYFSWQRSHAMHHAKCNHLTEGETHAPLTEKCAKKDFYIKAKEVLGVEAFAIWQIFNILVLGWPAYLIFGVTGAPDRGKTSHFLVPNKLFPSQTLPKVHASNIGLLIVILILVKWGMATSFGTVAALYLGPYLVVNAWLTGITFLQHANSFFSIVD